MRSATPSQVKDATSAEEFLQAHDALVRKGEPIHRVVKYIASDEPWALRKDMVHLARTGSFTPRLAMEIAAYHMCLVDETAVEAVHRDISREGSRVTYQTFPYIAATLRLEQNLSDIGRLGPVYEKLVEMHYDRITSITRKEPLLVERNRAVRSISFSQLCDQVYRCHAVKFVHFGLFETRMLAFKVGNARKDVCNWRRLRVDHLRTFLAKSAFLSVSDVENHAIADLSTGGGDGQAAVRSLRDATRGLRFFQIIDPDYGRKKILNGQLKARMRTMAMPVMWQPYEVFASDGQPSSLGTLPGSSHLIRPEGDPGLVDLLDVAPWPIFRLACYRWDACDSEYPGVLTLRDPLPLEECAAIEDRVSALQCIEKLFAAGWSFDRDQPAIHDMSTRRAFWTSNPLTSRPYMQCLLALPDLINSGTCGGVSSSETVAYYKRLLRPQSSDPLPIENNLDERMLDEVVAHSQDNEPLPLEDDAASPSSGSEQPAPAVKKRRTGVLRLRRSVDVLGQLQRAMVVTKAQSALHPLPSPPRPPSPLPLANIGPDEEGGPAAMQAAASQSELSLALVPCDGDPVPARDVAVAASDVDSDPPVPYGPHMFVLPLQLEGQNIRIERHDYLQTYSRLIVRCTCRLHGPCEKKRNTGKKQTMNFGAIEPYAFLGCWLRAASRFDAKAEHLRHEPSLAEMQAYIREHFPAYFGV